MPLIKSNLEENNVILNTDYVKQIKISDNNKDHRIIFTVNTIGEDPDFSYPLVFWNYGSDREAWGKDVVKIKNLAT